MLSKNVEKASIKKFIFFFLGWWVIGILIASIWGLGWFFLIETIRRIFTYFQPLSRWLRRIFLGKNFEVEPIRGTETANVISRIMGGVIIVVWVGLTILVFMKANISLVMILEYLRTAK